MMQDFVLIGQGFSLLNEPKHKQSCNPMQGHKYLALKCNFNFQPEIKKNTSGDLYSWIFIYIIQVAEMLKARAKQQLSTTNLQPTNLLFNHNS